MLLRAQRAIEPLTLDSGQLMTFIVSGGLSGRGDASLPPPKRASAKPPVEPAAT